MKLIKLLVLSLFLVPSFVHAQDASQPAPAPSVNPDPAPVVVAPSPVAPLANLDLNSALNTVDADIMFLVNDVKTNTKFQVNSVTAVQGFDWKNGQWLTGVGLPFLNIGSYDYFAVELFRQTTTGGGVGSKAIPMIANQVRLNALTSPAVKWALSRVPLLNNNPSIVNKLSNATDVGLATGHDFNSDINQKVVFNRLVLNMSFTYKFGGAALPTVQ